jgi:hypothetical protein
MQQAVEVLDATKNRRRSIARFIALLIVLGEGVFISTIVYGNSPAGIGRVFGEFIGVAVFALIIGLSANRRGTYMPALVVIVAGFSLGGANLQKVIASFDARQGIAALSEVPDPAHIDQALKENPSNAFLQLMAGGIKLAQETNVAAIKLSEEIEPRALANLNFTSATRADLKKYVSDPKIAEANAASAMPRYIALLKKERADLEALARSLSVGMICGVLS